MSDGGTSRDLLLLCHRLPFPPDKGDKIRSYRWLSALAERYRVHLVAFVDDENDWRYASRMREVCAEVCLLPLVPNRAKLRSLPALLNGAPLSERYYRDRRAVAWVADLMQRRRIERVVVYSSAMAQYVRGPRFAAIRRVIDFVDVDSDKWRQYAERQRGPMAWVHAREARRLLHHDAAIAREFDLSLFVSSAEAEFFRHLTGIDARVDSVANGVDHVYFAPAPGRPSPYPAGQDAVAFTGAMDYWANLDAVRWFARDVWPAVRERVPTAVFYIVGARPGAEVQALAGDRIIVTGRVPDVRPYLQYAGAVIAPMRIARGIQNKVLEGMAMARPVITSNKGLEGIDSGGAQVVLVADEPHAFAERVCEALLGRHGALGAAARAFVQREFDWSRATERFAALVEGTTPNAMAPAFHDV